MNTRASSGAMSRASSRLPTKFADLQVGRIVDLLYNKQIAETLFFFENKPSILLIFRKSAVLTK